jgi:hypothetical protein
MRLAAAEDWMQHVRDRIPGFLAGLQKTGRPGRYQPVATGCTPEGEKVALGFSCFAAKIARSIGLWEQLPQSERTAWIGFIQSFQADTPPHAFRDPAMPDTGPVTLSETKQAAATLRDLGSHPKTAYQNLPSDPAALLADLGRHDWSMPWAAGGLSSGTITLLCIQGQSQPGSPMHQAGTGFFDGLVDRQSGGYWRGPTPEHGLLVNGAMKVLTAMDWLEQPIHYPARLIDTCLSAPPVSEGCHLVDAVYVLWRCQRQAPGYRELDIHAYALDLLDAVKRHERQDGGFSYFPSRSQTHYYGVPITRGEPVGDMHGTILLCWALAMIRELLGQTGEGWSVIRP